MEKELRHILKYLPVQAAEAVALFSKTLSGKDHQISEIRLRANAPMSVSCMNRNVHIFGGEMIFCNAYEVAATLQKLCEDSVHTYSETLKEGFVALENGYRIGVCGRAGTAGDSIKSIYEISSLAIRIPHPVSGISGEILRLIAKPDGIAGVLFYAPPNVGKTTLIRDLASSLSSGVRPRKTALIDTRGEIYMKEMFENNLVDVLRGYPRAKGIEIATRTLSPEVIFCDEIGSAEEAKAILSAQNSGVPLIATAHADSRETLFRRPNIRILYENEIFRYYIGIKRRADFTTFDFDVFDAQKERAL